MSEESAARTPGDNASSRLLRNDRQWAKMTVSVTEIERLDSACAGLHGIGDRGRSGGGKSDLAILFPGLVQRFESRL